MATTTRALFIKSSMVILAILVTSSESTQKRKPDENVESDVSKYNRKAEPPSDAVKAVDEVQEQAKHFQDFFSVQLSPHKMEFGHVCEDPHNWEQRYESKDYKKHRDMGKVRWGDKNGGYGEHYWDFNHAGAGGDSQDDASENNNDYADVEYDEDDDDEDKEFKLNDDSDFDTIGNFTQNNDDEYDDEESEDDDEEEDDEEEEDEEEVVSNDKEQNKLEMTKQPINSSQTMKPISQQVDANLGTVVPNKLNKEYQDIKNLNPQRLKQPKNETKVQQTSRQVSGKPFSQTTRPLRPVDNSGQRFQQIMELLNNEKNITQNIGPNNNNKLIFRQNYDTVPNEYKTKLNYRLGQSVPNGHRVLPIRTDNFKEPQFQILVSNEPIINGPLKHGPLNHGPLNHGLSNHGPSNDGALNQGTSNHGAINHGSTNHRALNYGPSDHGLSNHGLSNYGPSKHGVLNSGPSNHGTSNHGPSNHGPSNHVPLNHLPSNNGPSNHGSLIHEPFNHGQGMQGNNEQVLRHNHGKAIREEGKRNNIGKIIQDPQLHKLEKFRENPRVKQNQRNQKNEQTLPLNAHTEQPAMENHFNSQQLGDWNSSQYTSDPTVEQSWKPNYGDKININKGVKSDRNWQPHNSRPQPIQNSFSQQRNGRLTQTRGQQKNLAHHNQQQHGNPITPSTRSHPTYEPIFNAKVFENEYEQVKKLHESYDHGGDAQNSQENFEPFQSEEKSPPKSEKLFDGKALINEYEQLQNNQNGHKNYEQAENLHSAELSPNVEGENHDSFGLTALKPFYETNNAEILDSFIHYNHPYFHENHYDGKDTHFDKPEDKPVESKSPVLNTQSEKIRKPLIYFDKKSGEIMDSRTGKPYIYEEFKLQNLNTLF